MSRCLKSTKEHDLKEFDEKERFENYLSNVKEELSKIVIQETKTSNTTINDLSEEDILKAEQAMEHLKTAETFT